MTKQKKIAIICNYTLNPNRIGGMDRFYVVYDKKAKELGYEVDWYFTAYQPFDFFSGLSIFSSNHQNVEQFFLEKLVKEKRQYDVLITHFIDRLSKTSVESIQNKFQIVSKMDP